MCCLLNSDACPVRLLRRMRRILFCLGEGRFAAALSFFCPRVCGAPVASVSDGPALIQAAPLREKTPGRGQQVAPPRPGVSPLRFSCSICRPPPATASPRRQARINHRSRIRCINTPTSGAFAYNVLRRFDRQRVYLLLCAISAATPTASPSTGTHGLSPTCSHWDSTVAATGNE